MPPYIRTPKPGTGGSQRRKPKTSNIDTASNSRTSTNVIKKRKRDLTRLLQHAEKLPADVRINHERELASCDTELETAKELARRSQMIKKYHMVRFFERRKAERYLKKARQRLVQCKDPSQVDALKEEVHLCDVDLQYTLYHPLNEAYSSLYKKEGRDKEKDSESEGKHEVDRSAKMWKVVEAAMESNRLGELREGRLSKKTTAKDSGTRDSGVNNETTGPSKEKKQPGIITKKGKKKEPDTLSTETTPKPAGQDVGDAMVEDEDEDETGAGFFES